MAKVRSRFANILGKLGNNLLGFLSRLEERGIMPGASRCLKVALVGFLVSAVTALTLHAQEYFKTCYMVAQLPDAYISDIEISPNPTSGADSVDVRALAGVVDLELNENYVSSAHLQLANDTTLIPLKALDGSFDEAEEELTAKICVGDLEPGTTWVYLHVNTSHGGWENQDTQIIVTEPDSTTSSGE